MTQALQAPQALRGKREITVVTLVAEVGQFFRFRKRQEELDFEDIRISMKAQQRLCLKYRRLPRCGKHNTVAVTALARELIGFIEGSNYNG